MQLKETSAAHHNRRHSQRSLVLYWAILFSCILAWAAYNIGWRENLVIGFIKDTSQSLRELPARLWGRDVAQRHPAEKFGLPHLSIFIKPNDLKFLAQKRQQAMSIYFLEKGTDDFVPATIEWEGHVYPVRLRLKGDFVDHLNRDKWSFRIEVKGDNAILGMKRFSIQHPITRTYLYEWVFFKLLRREGCIALNYDFLTASLNGRPLGIYAVEEHFEKRLIESNNRREGPILRFDEDLSWWARINRLEQFGSEIEEAPIESFDTASWRTDPQRRAIHDRALDLLESFRSGKYQTRDVFDIPTLARYYAVCEIMGNEHSRVWNNLRYYYNPITSKLEPIGYDAYIGNRFKPLVITDVRGFPNNRIFADPEFLREYVRTLRRMEDKSYLDQFFAEVGPELDRLEKILQTEWPEYRFDRSLLYDNQSHFRKALHPTMAIHAYLRSADPKAIVVQAGNVQPIPVEFTGLKIGNQTVRLPEPYVLETKYLYQPMHYKDLTIPLPDGVQWDGNSAVPLKATYRLMGLEEEHEAPVYPWSQEPGYLGPELIARQSPNAAEFPFITIDDDAKLISIHPGEHQLTKDLIIPPGYRVICGEGTTLDLCNSALIYSYSALDWAGSQTSPIALISSDGTGQGLVVINPPDRSKLTYVVFSRLRFPKREGWELTGSATFYNTTVDMRYCAFWQIQAEDGLNLVRCEFELFETRFEFCASDAFDADFCNGEFKQCYFLAPGNDAIDVSGSCVTVRNSLIQAAHDKGISSGEHSITFVYSTKVERSEIALASKDMSELRGWDVTVENSRVGVTAFRKKPEFGPAFIELKEFKIGGVEKPYLIEKGSEVVVNETHIPAELTNVEAMLYGVQYGRASNH